MRLSKEAMRLYAVTDRSWLAGKTLRQKVEEALKGGITFLQLREKEMPYADFLAEAKDIVSLARGYRVPVVINDNVDIAMAAGADGVHIGQDDGDIKTVRRTIGDDKILGVSVQTVEQAKEAERAGADYLGVGAMFPTDTKTDAVVVSKEDLLAISQAVDIPIVIIGGINKNTVSQFKGYGADGAAVVSGIFASEDSCQAAAELLKLCREVF